MSANIAQLGITVDSSGVKTASASLDKLTQSAKGSQGAVVALQSATAPAGNAMIALGSASAKATSAHQGLSTQGMAAAHAIRSMGESIAMGMPLTTVFTQQLNHLSYAASGPGGLGGAFKEVSSTLLGSIPTWALVGGGLAAVAVGAGIAVSSIAKSEVAFGALADRAGTTVQSLHALQSAASFRGISSDDFTKSMEKFSDLTAEAKNNMGGLAETFRANGVAAGSLEDNFSKAADLIKNAKDDASRYAIIQQMGLPPTAAWVDLLRQGSAGIKAATAAAVEFGGAADTHLVEKAKAFDTAWNTTWTNFVTGSKSAVVESIDWLDKLSSKAESALKALGVDVTGNLIAAGRTASLDYGPNNRNAGRGSILNTGPGTDTKTVNTDALKKQISDTQQLIGILGAQASIDDVVKQKENEIALARLAGVPITKSQSAAILEYTRNQALGVNAIREQVGAERIAYATADMSIGQGLAYESVQRRINSAIIAGAPLRADQIAQLRAEAQVLGVAAQAVAVHSAELQAAFATSQIGRSDADAAAAAAVQQLYKGNYSAHLNDDLANTIRLNTTLTDLKGTASSALSGFLNDLTTGKGSVVALTNLMGNLEKKLIDIASNQIVSSLFKNLLAAGIGGGGGGEGFIGPPTHHSGGIAGIDAGPARYVPASIFAHAPKFHSGGLAGDESPAILQRGEGIFTKAQMRALSPTGSGGGNHVSVVVNNNAPNTQAQVSKRRENGVDVHEIIISAVSGAMAQGTFDGSMRARFGAQVQPRGR